MLTDRRQNKAEDDSSQGDLLSILMQSEFFEGNDDFILDELITFFLAGMKTI